MFTSFISPSDKPATSSALPTFLRINSQSKEPISGASSAVQPPKCLYPNLGYPWELNPYERQHPPVGPKRKFHQATKKEIRRVIFLLVLLIF